MQSIKKVVIIGPESTGKSSLCEHLAAHYNTIWCPEFAREYLTTNGKKYDFEDLEIIAKGQLALEDEYMEKLKSASGKTSEKIIGINPKSIVQLPIPNSQILFIDTNMYVMKVWSEYVFGKCHLFILDQIVQRKYDLYLLCNIDLPWTADELREYPDDKPRQELYNMYQDILINQQVPWVKISGNYEERLKEARLAVDKVLYPS